MFLSNEAAVEGILKATGTGSIQKKEPGKSGD